MKAFTKDGKYSLRYLRSEAKAAGVSVYRFGGQWMIAKLVRDELSQCWHERPAHYLDDERAALVRALGL